MVVIVVGMHRSGTSALAGVLHKSGIHMGDSTNFRPKPMAENPKGFFENHDFRAVNDQVLRENGYSVKSFSPKVPNPMAMEISESARRQMVKLVRDHNALYKWWGWKDPRTCLTLRLWLETLEEEDIPYKLVATMRPHADIAESMRRRGNREKYPGQFVALCRAYCDAARMQGHQFIEVYYGHLMYDTEGALEMLGTELGIKLVDDGFVDPALADRATAEVKIGYAN